MLFWLCNKHWLLYLGSRIWIKLITMFCTGHLLKETFSCLTPLNFILQDIGSKVIQWDHFLHWKNLTVSQSGSYRVEGWNSSSPIDQKSLCLTICRTHTNPNSFGGSLDLCEPNPTVKDLTTLQLHTLGPWYCYLEVDTKLFFEVLCDELKKRSLPNLDRKNTAFQANRHLPIPERQDNSSLSSPMKLTLTKCFGYLLVALPLPKDSTQILQHDATQRWVMHMLNGSKTGSYSFVLPCV